MPDPDIARQPHHVVLLEDIADQAVILPQAQLAVFLGHDARGILPPMLKDRQRIVDRLIDRPLTDNSNDSAHIG